MDTDDGPVCPFNIQGPRSKGIKNMPLSCFDILTMRLCAKRKVGPGILVHDSRPFAGVDDRPVAEVPKVGAKIAEELVHKSPH